MISSQFEYAYLFGAVCPATGETEALIAPWVSQDEMEKHLEQISQRTASGRHAVIIADGVSWHTQRIMKRFSNLSLIIFPPYSPELNLIE